MTNPTNQDALDNLAYLSEVDLANGKVADTDFYKIIKSYLKKDMSIQKIIDGLVLTEIFDTGTWYMNFNKFNDDSDIEISDVTALELLALKAK